MSLQISLTILWSYNRILNMHALDGGKVICSGALIGWNFKIWNVYGHFSDTIYFTVPSVYTAHAGGLTTIMTVYFHDSNTLTSAHFWADLKYSNLNHFNSGLDQESRPSTNIQITHWSPGSKMSQLNWWELAISEIAVDGHTHEVVSHAN